MRNCYDTFSVEQFFSMRLQKEEKIKKYIYISLKEQSDGVNRDVVGKDIWKYTILHG